MQKGRVAQSLTLNTVGRPRHGTTAQQSGVPHTGILHYDWTKNGGQVKTNLKYLRDVETAIARIARPKNNKQEGSVPDDHFLAALPSRAPRSSQLPKLTTVLDYAQMSDVLKPLIAQPVLAGVSAWPDHHEGRLASILVDVFPDGRLNRLARRLAFEQGGQTIFARVHPYLFGTDGFLRVLYRSNRDIADPEQSSLFGLHAENANKFVIE
jgi:hypothetical protein